MYTQPGRMTPDEEVGRILMPADPGKPYTDAWNIVTVTRPRGSRQPVWKPGPTFGPMTLDEANKFLLELGVSTVNVDQRAAFPILETLMHSDSAPPDARPLSDSCEVRS